MLDVTTAVIGPRQLQSLKTDKGDGFGFNLSQTARGHLGISQPFIGLCGVTEYDVGDLMKAGLVWQFGNGRHGDCSLACVPC